MCEIGAKGSGGANGLKGQLQCNTNSCCKCPGGSCTGVYVQPPRPTSCRPCSSFTRSTEPMELDTVYKRSYDAVDPKLFASIKPAPIRHEPILQVSNDVKVDDSTVYKLSFQPHKGVCPPAPIRNENLNEHRAIHCKMETMTTHKQDYVPKPIYLTPPIKNEPQMGKCDVLPEALTVNRLSYVPIDVKQFPPPRPIRNDVPQAKPKEPTESKTIYKMSYLPFAPVPRADMPWAKTIREIPPPPQELDTIYRRSYLPNCNLQKLSPIRHDNALKSFGDEIPVETNTVYKLSFVPYCKAERPRPIRHDGEYEKVSGDVESNTIYRLSFVANPCAEKTQPINPIPTNIQRFTGYVQTETTNKHDYVPKLICRQKPIRQDPSSSVLRSDIPMETTTISRLSYMPIDVCSLPKTRAIRNEHPTPPRNDTPFEGNTVYKMSFLPVSLPAREKCDLANQKKTQLMYSTEPLETTTVQRMSYMPPGKFISCTCACKENPRDYDPYPKAGIVK